MKMKLRNLLIGTIFISASISTFAQDENRECDRMKFLATEDGIKIENYAVAASYYLKGEAICGNYDAADYARLTGSLRNAAISASKEDKELYNDTLTQVYDRMEEKGLYDKSEDLIRATAIVQNSKPDLKKADELFVRGKQAEGDGLKEMYVNYYYYNLYKVYKSTKDEAAKKEYKKRMITDYFALSTIVNKGNMSAKTQERLIKLLDAVVTDCDALLPELGDFMKALPQDKEAKISTVNNLLGLMEDKSCTESPEYAMLIDTLVAADPTAIGVLIKQGDLAISKGQSSKAVSIYKDAQGKVTDEATKNELQYKIAYGYYKSGSYSASYSAAMAVSGNKRSDALEIAANSVAANANNCGDSTFERKCNYLYASQLASQAGKSSLANKYAGMAPTSGECFDAGNPGSVTLTCYGVTVSPCN